MNLQPEIKLLFRVVTMAKVLAEQNGSELWLAEVDQAYTALDDISQFIADEAVAFADFIQTVGTVENERVEDA